MSFSSPSDRLFRVLKDFFSFRPINALRLCQAAWILTLLVCGFQIVFTVVEAVASSFHLQAAGIPQFVGTSFSLFYFTVERAFFPLSWILIVRILLELALQLLPTMMQREVAPRSTDD